MLQLTTGVICNTCSVKPAVSFYPLNPLTINHQLKNGTTRQIYSEGLFIYHSMSGLFLLAILRIFITEQILLLVVLDFEFGIPGLDLSHISNLLDQLLETTTFLDLP